MKVKAIYYTSSGQAGLPIISFRSSLDYTSVFAKHFKKLPKNIQMTALRQEKRFRANPLQPQLKTHALSGKLKGYHSFSVTYRYRILFAVEAGGNITFIDIGTHSIYR